MALLKAGDSKITLPILRDLSPVFANCAKWFARDDPKCGVVQTHCSEEDDRIQGKQKIRVVFAPGAITRFSHRAAYCGLCFPLAFYALPGLT